MPQLPDLLDNALQNCCVAASKLELDDDAWRWGREGRGEALELLLAGDGVWGVMAQEVSVAGVLQRGCVDLPMTRMMLEDDDGAMWFLGGVRGNCSERGVKLRCSKMAA
jgi:hypothetical protein